MSEVIRNPKILKKENTALLIIDIQERILGVIRKNQMVVENTQKLIRGAKIFGLPIYYTEQYPKGLGETIRDIKAELEDNTAVQKMTFSCSGAENLFQIFQEKNITQIVVCGIESHVCVQQTVLDLLHLGVQVNVPADAVSSRKKLDYNTALDRMRTHGAEITTTESILFELLEVCGTPEFKAISKLVK